MIKDMINSILCNTAGYCAGETGSLLVWGEVEVPECLKKQISAKSEETENENK